MTWGMDGALDPEEAQAAVTNIKPIEMKNNTSRRFMVFFSESSIVKS